MMPKGKYTSIIWLSKGKYAIVDNEDYIHLMQWSWSLMGEGYATRSNKGGQPKNIRMHRQLMGQPIDLDIDHINRNKLDNRKANLRICTKGENNRNRDSYGRSQYKGVGLFKGRWRARIAVDKKRVFLGYFSSEQEAARAYDIGVVKYHGAFGRLNFPRYKVKSCNCT